MNDTAPNHIEQVYHWLIEGNTAADIMETLSDDGLADDQVKFVIEQALKKFLDTAALPPEVRQGWCLEAYRHLYRKLVATGDYTGAIRCIQEIAKLSGADKAGPPDPDDADHEIDSYIDRVLKI